MGTLQIEADLKVMKMIEQWIDWCMYRLGQILSNEWTTRDRRTFWQL